MTKVAIKGKKIEKFLKNPVTVCAFDEIDSTNNEAKRRAEADRGRAVLYVTDHQTAGRGRRGHDFYSPKGSGLYFTLSLPLSAQPADIQVMTCVAAVATCEAIEALTNTKPRIKWVNDILIDGKKVAGILTELVSDGQNRPLSVIIGIGINLTTDHFPAEFAATAGCVGKVDPNRLCAAIVDHLINMYMIIVGDGALDVPHTEYSFVTVNHEYNSILEKYKQLNTCIGKGIRYTDTSGEHIARAVDIAMDGSLIIEENGTQKTLHSGEISIIPLT